MAPFLYPSQPLVRRHGPHGYRSPSSYRPWLRDEFTFRCVFCLRREQWDKAIHLQIDHFQPTSKNPSLELEYENLLYACSRCNTAKSDLTTADPTQVLLADTAAVLADGTVAALSPGARRLIAQLRLNSPDMVHFRRLWLEIVAMAAQTNSSLHRELLGFPAELPNLSSLRPPGGNLRPAGVEESYFARRERHDLPEVC